MESQRIDLTPEFISRLAAAGGVSLTLERCRELIPHVRAAFEDLAKLAELDVSTYEAPIIVPRPKPERPGPSSRL